MDRGAWWATIYRATKSSAFSIFSVYRNHLEDLLDFWAKPQAFLTQ